jgi:hypothetical protein
VNLLLEKFAETSDRGKGRRFGESPAGPVLFGRGDMTANREREEREEMEASQEEEREREEARRYNRQTAIYCFLVAFGSAFITSLIITSLALFCMSYFKSQKSKDPNPPVTAPETPPVKAASRAVFHWNFRLSSRASFFNMASAPKNISFLISRSPSSLRGCEKLGAGEGEFKGAGL